MNNDTNNDISQTSNQIQSDLFSNMQIPEYDAKNSVATTSTTASSNNGAMDIPTICIFSGIILAVIVLLVILMNSLKPAPKPIVTKQRTKTISQPKIEEEDEEIPKKQQVMQTKKADESSNFATPNNVTKCIRLFLETTRIK